MKKNILIVLGATLAGGPELTARFFRLLDNVHGFSGVPGLLIFSVIWALSLIACLQLSKVPGTFPRVMLASALLIASTFTASYYLAMQEPLEVIQFEKMVREASFLTEAITQYQRPFSIALLISTPLTLGIILPPNNQPNLTWRSLASRYTPALFCILFITSIGWIRSGQGTVGMPPFFRPFSYATLIGVDNLKSRAQTKKITMPTLTGAQHEGRQDIQNVVLIIDESITTDIFKSESSLHISTQVFSRFNESLTDFKEAVSSANCSWSANLLLRRGPRQANVLKDLSNYASIWDYAKAAGYSTTYIDMQENSDRLHNGMDAREHALIDSVVVAPKLTTDQRDTYAGKILNSLISDHKKHFIYINKVGAHFPYDAMYPETHARYQPILGTAADRFTAYVDGREKQWDVSDKAGSPALLNSYKNAAEWNFNSFFDGLAGEQWLDNTILIYTSDHGQNHFREDGKTNTHCSGGGLAAKSEGVVPLFFITNAADWKRKLDEGAKINAGRVSHFNLFATTISFMGFDPESIVDQRDVPVWSTELSSSTKLQFLDEISPRFGGILSWATVCAPSNRLNNGQCIRDIP